MGPRGKGEKGSGQDTDHETGFPGKGTGQMSAASVPGAAAPGKRFWRLGRVPSPVWGPG